MDYIHSWSGGKDSTASIILDFIHNSPPIARKVIFAEVMFDKERDISGETPAHIEWINTIAIPRLESMGFEVIKARADRDYIDCFFRVRSKCKDQTQNGKIYGYPVAGGCIVNRDVKMNAIKKANKIAGKAVQILGIAVDEPERLAGMHKRGNQISLLEKYGYTEGMALDLCKKMGATLSNIFNSEQRWVLVLPQCSDSGNGRNQRQAPRAVVRAGKVVACAQYRSARVSMGRELYQRRSSCRSIFESKMDERKSVEMGCVK